MAYSADPTLFLYTSLTAGSSHIITATSRLETILKANKIPFRAIDCATDEKARMVWGRRSKGRKLPGLVRFGSVVGDLEQIEEWNEYGELKDQINATADPSSGGTPTSAPSRPTTLNTSSSLQPEPPTIYPRSPSNASSRASSQGRHISISEPTAEEKKRDPSPNPTSEAKARSPAAESPQNLIMRQLGAEAAMKAKDRKPSSTKAAPVPTTSSSATSTAQTPTAASAKEQEATHPSAAPEMTAAKTPAMLASEGKTKMSTDKIEDNETSPTSTPAQASSGHTSDSEDRSTEAQLLDLRRSSTQTRQPSRLSVATPVEKSGDVLPNQDVKEEEVDPFDKTTKTEPTAESLEVQSKAAPETEPEHVDASSSQKIPPPERRRSFHRGSSLEEADTHAIRKAEAAIRIQEEDEVDEADRKSGEEESTVEGIRKRASVGIGKDAASNEVITPADENDRIFALGEPTKEGIEGGNDMKSESKQEIKDLDAAKEEEMKDAEVPLPTGKETDVEGKDTTMKEIPQDTDAAEMEDASKSVGD